MKKVFSLLMVLALVMVGMAQTDAAKPKKSKKTHILYHADDSDNRRVLY